jgi:RNA polymerase sigma-70 factor (ECF subfamily)
MDRHVDGRHEVDVELGRAWREHRRHLLDVAFRILENLGDAEDAVQEAFTRLAAADPSEIDDVGGWLVVVVSRVCFDRLRAARRHPTTSAHSLEPPVSPVDVDPADRVTLDDTVRVALHLLLERLSPAERTAFVLHDVFRYPFDAIGDIVGRSPAACRQLASRARRMVGSAAARSRFAVESPEHRRVAEQFMVACATGDIDQLVAVLDPNIDGDGDLGAGRRRIAVGRDQVAPLVMQYLGPNSGTTLVSVPVGEDAGVVALQDGTVVAVLTLTIEDGRVVHMHALVDPLKLAPIADAFNR